MGFPKMTENPQKSMDLVDFEDFLQFKPAFQLAELDLASRLSFFLWGTSPDEELMNLAQTGELSKPGDWKRTSLQKSSVNVPFEFWMTGINIQFFSAK